MSKKDVIEIKSIKIPKKEGGNIKLKKKLPKKVFISIVCVSVAVVLALCGILAYTLLTKFDPQITDKHQTMNALPERLSGTIVLKDGGIYLCTSTSQKLIDGNVYDAANSAAASQVSYIWDNSNEALYYLSTVEGQKNLMLYKEGDENPSIICKNVSSWSISPDKTKIAVITNADSTGMHGNLMLIHNGESKLLEVDCAKSQATYFSGDSSTLYALVGNNAMSELRMYRDDESQTMLKEMFALGWVSNDGNSFMTVDMGKTVTSEESSLRLYDYTFHNTDNKSLTLKDCYYLEVSPDGSVIYVMHSYDQEKQLFTLSAIDTGSLNHKTVASEVFAMNPQAVTDCSKGVIYATATAEDDKYDLYYFDTKSQRCSVIVKNSYADSMNKIVIDPHKSQGYVILSNGSAQSLYKLQFKNGNITTNQVTVKDSKQRVTQMHELIYYEACHTVVISANASLTSVELYYVNGSASGKLINDCGAIYDGGEYYSCSMLSNDGKYLVYLKDVVVISETDEDKFTDHPSAQVYGKLRLYNAETGDFTVISDEVLADTFDCIQVDAKCENIYFSKLTKDGKFDIYHYQTATDTTTLLMSQADTMLSIAY